MTSPLLAIENLSVGFRQQQHVRPVVNAISLQVNAGETLALVGESGSGKSVTALSILRLLPTPPAVYLSGDIRFHGESLLHASEQTLRGVRGNKIAMIFQEPMVSLNPLHTLEHRPRRLRTGADLISTAGTPARAQYGIAVYHP